MASKSSPNYRAQAHYQLARSLFMQNKPEEARKLFSQAEAQMPPLPIDETKPIIDGKSFDRDLLVMWLAYKEAKALIGGPSAP